MNAVPPKIPPLLPEARVPVPEKTLRRLFLTLFLRGRTSRGLQKQGVPKSIGQKLATALAFYALFGLFAVGFLKQPVFALSTYLHAMTFVFLGMFVASSAGEILFNKEEADILLHRPITPRALLWSKIRVMVEVSLWLAGALNLTGFLVGLAARDGGALFPVAHVFSTVLEALFCCGCVVMVYQLCLRWFGRERLEGLMTATQVLVSVAVVLSGQILPQVMRRFDHAMGLTAKSWWVVLLPPAWFAGFDDAIAGSASLASWVLAALAVSVTALVLWIAFSKLARDYEAGLQTMSETVSRPARNRNSRRWIDLFAGMPPLRWWLRHPVERASFILSAAYLMRDREVKLRVYPGIAPLLMMPFIFLFQGDSRSGNHGFGGFGVAFAGCYLGLIPLMGLSLLQYSQQWQATDIFRSAPLPGPAPLCHGARRAVLFFLTLPMLIVFAMLAWFLHNGTEQLPLLLPGMVALPVYALVPNLGGRAVPLSVPPEEAKSVGRGLSMIAVMLVSLLLSFLTTTAWSGGWFWWMILVEAVLAIVLYIVFRLSFANARWPVYD